MQLHLLESSNFVPFLFSDLFPWLVSTVLQLWENSSLKNKCVQFPDKHVVKLMVESVLTNGCDLFHSQGGTLKEAASKAVSIPFFSYIVCYVGCPTYTNSSTRMLLVVQIAPDNATLILIT